MFGRNARIEGQSERGILGSLVDGTEAIHETIDRIPGVLEPIGDRVLIRPDPVEEMTASKILYKPNLEGEKSMRGEVVAVGDGVEQRMTRLSDDAISLGPKLSVGDRVLYGKYSGTEIEHEGEKLLIVRYPDLLAVMR